MSFYSFLLRKKFYLYLGISIVLTLIIIFVVLQLLKSYTNFGETYDVPDFYGMTIDELIENEFNENFEFVIIDSIFDPRNRPQVIVIQNPIPGSVVKKNRKIYVTVVASSVEKVEMPNLIDLTLRQAINRLIIKGLKVKRLEYVHDFAENAVLEQLYSDETIEPGALIEKGSGINLILGLGDNSKVPVPFLIGLNETEAIEAINRASFNTGSVLHRDGYDEVHSRVYKQYPDWSEKAKLYKGQKVRIWLRSDLDYNFEELIRKYIPDTISSGQENETEALPDEF